MTNLIIFILCALSATNLLQNEYIFQWLRNLVNSTKLEILIDMFNCPTCLGFWIGIGGCFIFTSLYISSLLINVIVCGLISSLSNKILYSTIFKL